MRDAGASEDRQVAARAGHLRRRRRCRLGLPVAARTDQGRRPATRPRSSARTCSSQGAILTRCCASTCRRPATGCSATWGSTSIATAKHGDGRHASVSSARGWRSRATVSAARRFQMARSMPCCRCPRWQAAPAPSDAVWPEGNSVQPSQDPAIAAILDDARLTGPGMRAVVVVQNGRIVGERYGRRVFARDAVARLVDDQVGERGDHRHAGQGRQACDRPDSNCSSRGRKTAARRSTSPT